MGLKEEFKEQREVLGEYFENRKGALGEYVKNRKENISKIGETVNNGDGIGINDSSMEKLNRDDTLENIVFYLIKKKANEKRNAGKEAHKSVNSSEKNGKNSCKTNSPASPNNAKQPEKSPQLSEDQIREIESMFMRRSQLEYELTKINSGKDGLQYLWVQTVQAAVNGDISGFLFYSNAFQMKVEQREKIGKEIEGIKNKADKKYHAYASGNELVEMLTQPISWEKTGDCPQMIHKGKELKEFRRAEGTEISVDRLKAWGQVHAYREG